MGGLKTTLNRWYRGLPPVTAAVLIGLATSYVALLILRLIASESWEIAWAWLALSPVDPWLRPWTLATAVLLHKDPFHVLFVGMAFASLAPWVERTLGRRRFLLLLLACLLSGSVLYLAVGLVAGSTAPAFGATGLVLGVMTAFSLLFPEAELRFWFAAPLKAKNLVWLIVGLDAILLASGMRPDVPVHAGAMLAAWVFLRKPWQPAYRRRAARWLDRLRGRR